MSGFKPRRPFELCLGGFRLALGAETKIMGVLNVTPDSFSDGGRYLDPGLAAACALRMRDEGAHIIDVGGESSRPGARPVSAREEIKRIRPVLRRLARHLQIPLSVDTYKYDVVCMALDEGAVLINDIYALRSNKRLARRIARYRAGIALMHMKGTPRTMQKKPSYTNFFGEIFCFLKKAAQTAISEGVSPSGIVVDPGFGFGKTVEQNRCMLSNLDFFSQLKFPVLVGLSRKSFIGNLLEVPVGERLYGSLAAAAAAIERGAHILRVHEVLPHKHLAAMMDSVKQRES